MMNQVYGHVMGDFMLVISFVLRNFYVNLYKMEFTKLFGFWNEFCGTEHFASIVFRTTSAMFFLSSSWLSPKRSVAQSLTSMMTSRPSLVTRASREHISRPPNISDTKFIHDLWWSWIGISSRMDCPTFVFQLPVKDFLLQERIIHHSCMTLRHEKIFFFIFFAKIKYSERMWLIVVSYSKFSPFFLLAFVYVASMWKCNKFLHLT